jgi:hypothetical protein
MYYKKIINSMSNAGEISGGTRSFAAAASAFTLSNIYMGNNTGAGLFGMAALSLGIASLVAEEEKKFGNTMIPKNLFLDALSNEMLKNSSKAGMYGALGSLTAWQSAMVMADGDLIKGLAGLMAAVSCSAMCLRHKLKSLNTEGILLHFLNNMKRE